MTSESGNASESAGVIAGVRGYEQSLTDLKGAFDKLNDFAFGKSAGVWGRYGVAGGSLVFGGAVAILALTATTIALKGWTSEDLITCMGFAVLLIIIGTATQLIDIRMKDRRFEAQVELYGKYEEAVRAAGRDILAALEAGKPTPANGPAPSSFQTS